VPAKFKLGHDYLLPPLLIVVENARCDGEFIRQILLRVGESCLRRTLGDAVYATVAKSWRGSLGDGVWFSIRHGGGSTTADQIKLAIEANPHCPPRMVVMVDSDRAAPGAIPSATAQAALDACAHGAVAYGSRWRYHPFVLEKREVENYIPHAALEARFGERRVQAALMGQNPDYMDLKAALERTLWSVMADASLQEHLHRTAWRTRAGGNGAELSELVLHVLDAL
jgi:hypothetical protein